MSALWPLPRNIGLDLGILDSAFKPKFWRRSPDQNFGLGLEGLVSSLQRNKNVELPPAVRKFLASP